MVSASASSTLGFLQQAGMVVFSDGLKAGMIAEEAISLSLDNIAEALEQEAFKDEQETSRCLTSVIGGYKKITTSPRLGSLPSQKRIFVNGMRKP